MHDDTQMCLNTTASEFYQESSWVKTLLLCILLPLMLIVGIVGNLINLRMFWRSKGTTYGLFCCLSSSDLGCNFALFVGCIIFGFDIRSFSYTEAFLVCRFGFTSLFFFLTLSALLMVGIAIDRYIAVCHPYKAKDWLTVRRTRITAGLCFLVALSSALPLAFTRKVTCYLIWTTNNSFKQFYAFSTNEAVTSHWVFNYFFKIILIVAVAIIYLFMTSVTVYTLISFRRYTRRRRVCGLPDLRSEARLIKFLVSIAVMFCLLITPYIVMFRLPGKDVELKNFVSPAGWVMMVLAGCHCSLNFCVFAAGSRHFRKEAILTCSHYCQRKRLVGSDTSNKCSSLTYAALPLSELPNTKTDVAV